MPYDSITDLPDAVRKAYSPRCQAVFLKAFNVANGNGASEESSFKVGHTAAGMCKDAGKADVDEAPSPEAKALMPIKAQVLDDDEHEAWFAGRIPRRILSIPFGGPIPSAKSSRGVDLDGEWFSERTDIFGNHRALRQTRERLVDFHHAAKPPAPGYGDPTGMMKGHFLGKSILDPNPEEDGWWSDFWWEAGSKRVALIKKLAERGTQLFGSSQPLGKAQRNIDGEITLWPHWLQTVSPAPQNTLSVIRPKAALDAVEAGNPFWSVIEASMHDLSADLRSTSLEGEDVAKSGRVYSSRNESDIRKALEEMDAAMGRVREVLARQPDYTAGREPASPVGD